MTPWRRTLLEKLAASSDRELQQAMLEIKAQDNSGKIDKEGFVARLSSDMAPVIRSAPEHVFPLVTRAVILAAAYRFAGLEPDPRRLT